MKSARHVATAAIFGLACCAFAHGRGQDPAGAWEEAQSLRELPAGIQALLGVGLGGTNGIADHGDSFNISDVIVDNTPQRRFALGIVNGNTTVVAVEQGGIGYTVQVLEFHQDGTTWEPARCTTRAGLPQTGADLLQAFREQRPGLVSSCRIVNGHVAVALAPAPGMAVPGTPVSHARPRPGA
jgi:hypothetical protein